VTPGPGFVTRGDSGGEYPFRAPPLQRALVASAGTYLVLLGTYLGYLGLLSAGQGRGQAGAGGRSAFLVFMLWAAYRAVKSGLGIAQLRMAEWRTGIIAASASLGLALAVFSISLADRPPSTGALMLLVAVTAGSSFTLMTLIISRRWFDSVVLERPPAPAATGPLIPEPHIELGAGSAGPVDDLDVIDFRRPSDGTRDGGLEG